MAEPTPATAAPSKPSMFPKIFALGLIASVVIAETFIFFFMVPSADDVAALAEARLIDKVEKSMEKDGEEKKEEDPNAIKEFQLGTYGDEITPPGSDRKYSVEFNLFGTVKAKDLKKLEALFKDREGRFKHRLKLEVRNATMDELTENQLGLLQRRILATSNDILGGDQPILLGIGFNDYQLREE